MKFQLRIALATILAVPFRSSRLGSPFRSRQSSEGYGHTAKYVAHGTLTTVDNISRDAGRAAKTTGHGIKKGVKRVGHGVRKGATKSVDAIK